LAAWGAHMTTRATLWCSRGGWGHVPYVEAGEQNQSQTQIELAVLGNSRRGHLQRFLHDLRRENTRAQRPIAYARAWQ